MSLTAEIPLSAITPEQLAEAFWGMDADQQAKFFNALGVLVLGTKSPFSNHVNSWFPLDWQMYHVSISPYALPLGKRAMEIVGQQVSGELLQPYLIAHEHKVRNAAAEAGGAS